MDSSVLERNTNEDENNYVEGICENMSNSENIRREENMRCSENIEGTEQLPGNSRNSVTMNYTKRNRQIDQEERWMTVTRRGKVLARASNIHDDIRIPEDKIEISLTSINILPKQFGLAKLLKTENIQDITSIKYINAYKVLIQFSNENSADKMIESETLKGKGFRCQKTLEIRQTHGVIKNIDIECTEEEILESLSCEFEVMGVKRLKRRNTISGHWEPGEAIRVSFRGSSLPPYVYIFDTRAIVSPYLYPVTQCLRCWRFGHIAKMCASIKEVCPKCSKAHPNCDTTVFKCNNCSGKHMSLSRTCPVYIKERRVRELMAEFNCSYKRALTLYVPPEQETFHMHPELSNEKENDGVERGNPEEDVNYSEHLNEERDITMTPILTPARDTYSNILQRPGTSNNQSQKNKLPKEKSKNKKTKDNHIMNLEEFICSNSEGSTSSSEEIETRKKSRKRENVGSWKLIFTQVKEKIWDSNTSIENKIKDCSKIIFDWISSLVLQYLMRLPFFAHIKQWTTVTDTNI